MNIDLDKMFDKFFSEDFMKENEKNFDKILEHIKGCTTEFNMEVTNDLLNSCVNKSKNNDYKIDNEVKLTDNKISLAYNFPSFWNRIKDVIPKSIKKISLPLSNGIIDVSYFSSFPSLEVIEISDYSMFNKEELEYLLKFTNVKKIISNGIYSLNKIDEALVSNKVGIYKDIIIERPNTNVDELTELNISTKKLDFNSLLLLNRYKNLKKLNIEVDDISYSIVLNGKDIEIKTNENNYNNLDNLLNMLKTNGFNISTLYLSVKDTTKQETKYVDTDFSVLDSISEKTNVIIGYDKTFVTTSPYSEFKGLIESMKWYKQIINDYDLSPLEKLTFAYDIMKTFPYNESENDKMDSRNPHRIIETGNIVCAGYTAMLKEMLSYVDDNIKVGDFSVTCYKEDDKSLRGYHSRSMVRIDDPKYDVHGIYALDSTWDSFKKSGKEVLGEDYDALSLYAYFLVPFTEYKKFFPHDTCPSFFEGKLSNLNTNLDSVHLNEEVEHFKEQEKEINELNPRDEKIFNQYVLGSILDDVEKNNDKIKCFDSKRLSFEKFLALIRNVRIAEGYKGEYLEKEIEKIAKFNHKYYNNEIQEGFELH